ncbi:copper transport protein ATOX1 isoform X1 [Salmo salar]|uniref:Copper transport protein ATOX1 n=1 Tax=Salmo salar TaxID=8030 RepID=A0A1S3SWL3_SALSA|nr:copper transport protein ATOX1 isoform X1 [Salmo salar]|eukprot:XP_014068733.1 PREDICTED: copper transport protein ATOX1 isoform X1 [Salmo salar]
MTTLCKRYVEIRPLITKYGVSLSNYLHLRPKHEFFVDMTCEGCSGAVTRVLNKLGGVQFEIDLPNKKVFIESDKDTDVLLETLKKTGKAANYIGPK